MTFTVKVQFGKDEIAIDDGVIVVGIRAKPVQGKANEELIKKLAKYFGVAQSRVRIIRGLRSKRKIVAIE